MALYVVHGDFAFKDFHDTTSLTLNGATKVTHCGASKETDSSEINRYRNDGTLSFYRDENGANVIETITTYTGGNEDKDLASKAIFGHRDSIETNITDACTSRLRLTPAMPSTAGSIWYNERLHVVGRNSYDFFFRSAITQSICFSL